MAHEDAGRAAGLHVCTTGARSGIADYAVEFQRRVLEGEGYLLSEPGAISAHAAELGLSTRFHFQLGIDQHAERRLMSRLFSQGANQIEATVHDPPFVTFPYFAFRSELLNRLSRGFDWYLRSMGLQRRALERMARVFTLSHAGRMAVLRVAPRANVVAIPHVVHPDQVWKEGPPLPPALLYFGFIGPSKGLDYALELHKALQRVRPETVLHVVGTPSGRRAESYYASLVKRYRDGVIFHGYVPAGRLDLLFELAAHVILPYEQYKYVLPTSGGVIHALRRGRIIWASPVNAIPEIIRDGENGFFLSKDLDQDTRRLQGVLDDQALARRVSEAARQSALEMALYDYHRHFGAPD